MVAQGWKMILDAVTKVSPDRPQLLGRADEVIE
jgi:hypothetical protein